MPSRLQTCGVVPLCVPALMLAFSAPAGAAQPLYPDKPLRFLVPFAPGGGNDVLARILATRMSSGLGQIMIVDNRAGAGGNLATDLTAKAAPDGYTLLLGFVGPLAVSPNLGKVPYDPLADFALVDMIASSYHMLVTHPALGIRNIKELVALAKAQPGKLNYASSGVGTNLHLMSELLKHALGVNLVHVAYKGTGPAATALLAGESQLLFSSLTAVLPHVRGGRLTALAVTHPARAALAPEVPTLIEQQVKGVDAPAWYALMAPAKTPHARIERLRTEMARVTSGADFREQIGRQGMEPMTLSSMQYAAFAKAELEKWGRAVKLAGVQPE